MTQTRPLSILPTVKCSNCSNDIQISQMGDHICNGTGQHTPPESSDIFDRTRYLESPDSQFTFSKTGVQLPRVDTNLAYRSNLQPGPYTPASASPLSSSPSYSYFSQALRSVSMPIPRALPTPEPVPTNLDCAFPPFPITKGSPAPSPKKFNPNFALKLPSTVPSVKNVDNDSFMQRLNGIIPGPFDINDRREYPDDKKSSSQIESMSSRKNSLLTKEFNMSLQRPSDTGQVHSRTSSNGSIGYKSSYSTPPKLLKKSGYDGFGPPKDHDNKARKLLSSGDRSSTFPPAIRSPSRDSLGFKETFSEQNISSPTKNPQPRHAPSNNTHRPRPSSNEVIDMLTSLLSKSKLETKPDNGLNIIESLNLGTSDDGKFSLSSSLSSVGASSYTKNADYSASVNSVNHLEFTNLKLSNTQTLPDKHSFASGPASQTTISSPPLPLIPDQKNLQTRSPLPLRQNTAPNLLPVPLKIPTHRSRNPSHSPSRSQSPFQSQQFRPTSKIKVSKGKCKGCGLEIYGKSVSSADGRLTGRYHKECFVCKACSEPFKTATFYVIDNSPYCERHYHKLNGSICSFCDKGIEGPCFETERKQKLHPSCLSCVDCKCRLHDIYYEMNGNFYCERDADRHARRNRSHDPNMNNRDRIERRTTRMMMV